MRIFVILFVIIGAFITNSCVERIDLFSGATPTLVIDGTITNEIGPHKIKLSFSEAFNAIPDYTRVEGAKVVIIDNLGNEEVLSYDENGYYVTSEAFQGVVGRSYQLQIELREGLIYESSFEKIEPVPAIDEVKYKVENNEVIFYVDYEDDALIDNYYRWRHESTYQVYAPEWNSSSIKSQPCFVSATRRLRDCWAKDFDFDYLLVSDDHLINGKSVTDFEVYRREKEDAKFAIGYSAQLKQYSISKEAFKFWSAINDQISNTGSIFDTSNYLIEGNIKCITNPEIVTLGYFGASAVSTKRVFVNNEELAFNFAYTCEPTGIRPSCIPIKCIDCRTHSGSSKPEKPDFWPI